MTDVTFEWYTTAFPGGAIKDAERFASVLPEAEAYIQYITGGKATEATDEVKRATCAVAEVIFNQAQNDAQTVSSESVGNHSKTYTKQQKSAAEWEAEKARKARLYLSRTGLLYRGLR